MVDPFLSPLQMLQSKEVESRASIINVSNHFSLSFWKVIYLLMCEYDSGLLLMLCKKLVIDAKIE